MSSHILKRIETTSHIFIILLPVFTCCIFQTKFIHTINHHAHTTLIYLLWDPQVINTDCDQAFADLKRGIAWKQQRFSLHSISVSMIQYTMTRDKALSRGVATDAVTCSTQRLLGYAFLRQHLLGLAHRFSRFNCSELSS